MQEKFILQKKLWTELDFDSMGWHDCRIHAIGFDSEKFELLFDIDYIFEWIHPLKGKTYFKFWIAPCMLIFKNVYNLIMEIEPQLKIDINNITRKNQKKPKNSDYINIDKEWDWIIETHVGNIIFTSVGYELIVRQKPILSSSQFFSLKDRKGFFLGRS